MIPFLSLRAIGIGLALSLPFWGAVVWLVS